MKLHNLCYILPADSDAKPAPPYNNAAPSTRTDKEEVEEEEEEEEEKQQSPSPPPRKHRRSCHDQLTKLLRRIYGSANIHCCSGPGEDQFSTSFHDAAGVDLQQHTTTETRENNNPRIFSYAELYIGTNAFSQEELLGSGGFGRVYKAVLPGNSTIVAVKCLAERGEHIEKTFMAELVAVAHLRHRNLVSLRGWCVHDDQLFLVYDYMPNSSLDRILFRSSSIPVHHPQPDDILGWETRRKIVRGLAAALFYLHEQLEAQIIHRDVKASNVMLDSNFNARLGDFGLARWLEHELGNNNNTTTTNHEKIQKTPSIGNHHYYFRLTETTRIGGTIGYLPPESFQRRKYVATAKSDVFSFGVVALEVASGRRSVDLAYPDEQIILLDWVRRLADDGKVLKTGDPKLPKGSYAMKEMELLIHLGLLCTLHNPKSRPTMRWVVEVLSGNVLGKLPDLPSFKLHPLYISVSSSSSSSGSGSSKITTVGSNTTSKSIAASTTTTTTTSTESSTVIYITASGKTLFVTAEQGSEDEDSNEVEESREANRGSSNLKESSSSRRHKFNNSNNPFPLIETPRVISYKELITATNNFSADQRIAEVDFGTAYHGFLDNHLHVIVKRLGIKTCPALRARFCTELQNLGRLRHRNLIQLRGWCTEHGEMLVVYDYMATRLLSHLLFHGDTRLVLQWNQRYSIIKSLASAILYLHEDWDEQVIHRHITSSSVILDMDMNPRLTSFALAEFLTRNEHGHHDVVETDKTKSARGIFGYMAPECVESGEANTAADVYSFGVVVMEVVTGQMAVDFRRQEVLLVQKVREFAARRREVEELADWRLDGEYDGDEFRRVMRLALASTHSSVEARPSIRQIVSVLDGNDLCFLEFEGHKERTDEWRHRNGSALSLVRRIQALGIQ